MVKIQINKDSVYYDGFLNENLLALQQLVEKKWDGVGYVTGFEGDGKSTLASQICYYLDPTLTLDRVCFTAKQFLDCCMNATKKQAILFDESYYTFSNKNMWAEINKAIISMLTMIRRKQLYIIIVAPTFFDINKYIAIHRARFMIRVYSKGLERGFFAFYNRTRKYELYIKGKRDHNINVAKPNFFGSFSMFFPFDEAEYETKKDAATKELQEGLNKSKPMTAEQTNRFRNKAQYEILLWLRDNRWLKAGAINALSKYYGIDRSTLYEHFSKIDALQGGVKDVVGLVGDNNNNLSKSGVYDDGPQP